MKTTTDGGAATGGAAGDEEQKGGAAGEGAGGGDSGQKSGAAALFDGGDGGEGAGAGGKAGADDGKAAWWKAPDLGVSAEKAGADVLSDAEWLENKGYKGFPDIVKAARQLESTIGAQNKIMVPKDAADAEGWAALAKAIGVPETPEGYELKLADGYDEGFVGAFREAAHGIGMAPHQAQALVAWFEGTTSAEAATNAEAARTSLQEEWKGDFKANMAHAQRGMAKLGLSPDDLNGMAVGFGLDKLIMLMSKIGKGLSEDNGLPGDGGQGGGQNGEAWAKARKAEILADRALGRKLQDGDPALKAEWAKINSIMAAAEEKRRAG